MSNIFRESEGVKEGLIVSVVGLVNFLRTYDLLNFALRREGILSNESKIGSSYIYVYDGKILMKGELD